MEMLNINGISCNVSGFKIASIKTNDHHAKYTITDNAPIYWTNEQIISNELRTVDLYPQCISMDGTNIVLEFANDADFVCIKKIISEYYPNMRGYFSCESWCNIFKITYPSANGQNTQINQLLENCGTIISKPKRVDGNRYSVYFCINDGARVGAWLNDIYLSDYLNERLQISLFVNTDAIPHASTFDYLFETVNEYIDRLFESKIRITYNNKIKFKCCDIGLQLQAKAAINHISQPMVLKSDSESIECLLGEELYNDHFNSPILDSLHNKYGKIVIKRSTGQIFIYGMPSDRTKIYDSIFKYFVCPTNKVSTHKIPIFSHSNIIASYVKNIEPFINSYNCTCSCTGTYLTIKTTGGNIERTSNIMQAIVTNIINNEPIDASQQIVAEKCTLCFNDVDDKVDLATCNCVYCKNCFRQLLFSQQTKCASCQALINLADLKFVNDLEISRIFTPILEQFLSTNKQYVRCLTPECASIYNNTGCKFLYCSTCSHVYCLECQSDYYGPLISHDGLSCDAYRKKSKIDTKSIEWLNKHTQKCPHCNSIIQRVDGCLHITCRQCKYEFCWSCLGKWSDIKHGFYDCTHTRTCTTESKSELEHEASEETRSESEDYNTSGDDNDNSDDNDDNDDNDNVTDNTNLSTLNFLLRLQTMKNFLDAMDEVD